MPDQAQLDVYCDSTAGVLFGLAVRLLAGREIPRLGSLLQPAGRAYAMTGLLRAFALHASRGQLYFPVDALLRHGVDRNAIDAGLGSPGLVSALAEFRELARAHYQSASRLTASVPPEARVALLPLELVPLYLDRMERADYDPLKTRVDVPQWQRQWRLWRAARALG
jgi:phytoene synthase